MFAIISFLTASKPEYVHPYILYVFISLFLKKSHVVNFVGSVWYNVHEHF